jgi:hypothetical protein
MQKTGAKLLGKLAERGGTHAESSLKSMKVFLTWICGRASLLLSKGQISGVLARWRSDGGAGDLADAFKSPW